MYDLCNYVIIYTNLKPTSKVHTLQVRHLAWAHTQRQTFPRRHSTGSFTIHTQGGVHHCGDRVF